MTTFHSRIELGKRYKDKRTGIEGHANVIAFQEHGCVEIMIEYMKEDKPENAYINELRLVTPNDAELDKETHVYESDLILGHKYEDIQTRIGGHLAIVEFHEFMSTRGIIKGAASDSKGLPALKYYSIDDFLLEDQETKQIPEDKSGKPSPVTHEVDVRR